MFVIKGSFLLVFPNPTSTMILSEDMILALAGQFKQLSHEPEKFNDITS